MAACVLGPAGNYAKHMQPDTSEHSSELLRGKDLDSSVGNALASPYRNGWHKARTLERRLRGLTTIQ